MTGHFDYIIVDGNNFGYRSFFGPSSNLINSEGINTTGLAVGIRILRSYIRKYTPKRIIFTWDGRRPEWRKKILSDVGVEYKGGRKEKRSEEESKQLCWTLSRLREWVSHCGIISGKDNNMEADDIIYQLVASGKLKGTKLIVSSDKDLYATFIYKDVSILDFKDRVVTLDDYKMKFPGVPPERFHLYKALTGDKSDNIPGIKGIGATTAIKFLTEADTPTEYALKNIKAKSSMTFLESQDEYKAFINAIDLSKCPYKISNDTFKSPEFDPSALDDMAVEYEIVENYLAKKQSYNLDLMSLS